MPKISFQVEPSWEFIGHNVIFTVTVDEDGEAVTHEFEIAGNTLGGIFGMEINNANDAEFIYKKHKERINAAIMRAHSECERRTYRKLTASDFN